MNRALLVMFFSFLGVSGAIAEESSYDCRCLSIDTYVFDDASGEEFSDGSNDCSEADPQAGVVIDFEGLTVRSEQTFEQNMRLTPVAVDGQFAEYSYSISDDDFKDGLAKSLSEIEEGGEPSAFVASMAGMAEAVFEHATVSMEGVLEVDVEGRFMRREKVEILMDMKEMMRGMPATQGQPMGNLLTQVNTVYRCATDFAELGAAHLTEHMTFPNTIEPFDKEHEYLLACAEDPICGSYRYETESGETGSVTIFEVSGAYYLSYSREDGVQYVGLGLLSGSHLAVTYFYEDGSDIGTTHYRIEGDRLLGEWISLGRAEPPQWENLRKSDQ